MSKLLVMIALLLIAAEAPAHAYIDPGTGALLLQALFAVVLGALYFFRQNFARLVSFLRTKTGRTDKATHE